MGLDGNIPNVHIFQALQVYSRAFLNMKSLVWWRKVGLWAERAGSSSRQEKAARCFSSFCTKFIAHRCTSVWCTCILLAAPAYPQNIICCTWILLKYHMLHLYALKISYTPPIPHLYTPPIYSLAYPKKSYMLYLHTLCRICIPSKYLMLCLHTLKISNAASAYSLLHLDAFKKSFAAFTYS